MREHPILFNDEMVRAILDGRKTQTRRAVKWPVHEFEHPDDYVVRKLPDGRWWPYKDHNMDENPVRCPYGQPGDRLWVREAWNAGALCECDGAFEADRTFDSIPKHRPTIRHWVGYRASYEGDGPWRPSIHMPRWASRITLEVASVRVELVQDISESDAAAEGIEFDGRWHLAVPHPVKKHRKCWPTARVAFEKLWQSINGNWDENPWVWVVEFKKVGDQ